MNQVEVAQILLDAAGHGCYLEIGVNTGSSFIPIKAQTKWGVDPAYNLTKRRLAKYALFSFLRLKTERLFKMTSDEFFLTHYRLLQSHGIDVCFVDGLHTYEQSLRDTLHALKYLKPNGVILIHDCNPTSETVALPASSIDEVINRRIPNWNGAWSGDVWKAIVHLRSLHDDLNVFVLDCDTGLGVLTKERPSSRLPYSVSDVQKMDYGTLEQNRKELLGLEPPGYLREFVRRRLPNARR